MGCGMCHAIAHVFFSYKDIKKHPEKASHLCPMQAELGIGDGRPWAPKCGRACAIVGTRPRRGQGSGKAMLPDIHFFLLVSLKWASAAGCTLPLTHPMTHGAYGRSAPPCDLVALREFWKSEKPSIWGTCSNMSMLHDYMVLRSREKCKREKVDNAIYSLFHGSYE